jgi:hypothetical protein
MSSANRKRRDAVVVKCLKFGEKLDSIPQFLLYAFDYLRTGNRLAEEGIFRLPGSNSELQELKEMLNDGKLMHMSDYSIHTVASLIKLYFRELPVPLCTYECFDMFMLANGVPIPENRLECLKKVLNFMPGPNLALFAELCLFLNEVSNHSKTNKMNAQNLSIVFAPNLLVSDKNKTGGNHFAVLKELANAQDVITTFIQHADFFFNSSYSNYTDYLNRSNETISPHSPQKEIQEKHDTLSKAINDSTDDTQVQNADQLESTNDKLDRSRENSEYKQQIESIVHSSELEDSYRDIQNMKNVFCQTELVAVAENESNNTFEHNLNQSMDSVKELQNTNLKAELNDISLDVAYNRDVYDYRDCIELERDNNVQAVESINQQLYLKDNVYYAPENEDNNQNMQSNNDSVVHTARYSEE